jgi:hypothetical protein
MVMEEGVIVDRDKLRFTATSKEYPIVGGLLAQ